MTEHQVHQVLLLPASVGGDVAQQQVLAQVFDSELHEPRPLEGGAAQQVAGGAAAQVLLKHRAQGAETLLTITADVLLEEKTFQKVTETRGAAEVGLVSDDVELQTKPAVFLSSTSS